MPPPPPAATDRTMRNWSVRPESYAKKRLSGYQLAMLAASSVTRVLAGEPTTIRMMAKRWFPRRASSRWLKSSMDPSGEGAGQYSGRSSLVILVSSAAADVTAGRRARPRWGGCARVRYEQRGGAEKPSRTKRSSA